MQLFIFARFHAREGQEQGVAEVDAFSLIYCSTRSLGAAAERAQGDSIRGVWPAESRHRP